ncbi:hypothetical protein [Streptomyces sp. NPDC054794]
MSGAHAVDLDDPALREMIKEALSSGRGFKRWNRFLQTPADQRRSAKLLEKLLLVTLVVLVLAVIVLALCALCAVAKDPHAPGAGAYGTLALVASGGVVGCFVLLRMHRARMQRAERRSD